MVLWRFCKKILLQNSLCSNYVDASDWLLDKVVDLDMSNVCMWFKKVIIKFLLKLT